MDVRYSNYFGQNFWQSVYKVTGIVTSRDLPAEELIWWYRGRCGKSEEAHSIMKADLAGGKLPSQLFGANAAWWQIMILAFNVNAAMKRLVLGGELGKSPHEGYTLLVDQPAWSRAGAGQAAFRSARRREHIRLLRTCH